MNLQRALETKLLKIGGPDIRRRILSAQRQGIDNTGARQIDSLCESSTSLSPLLRNVGRSGRAIKTSVVNNSSSSGNSRLMGSMLNYFRTRKVNGRKKNIALIFFFLSLLAAVFMILRKRQNIKRVLSIMFRLKKSQAALVSSDRAITAQVSTLVSSN